MRIARSLEAVEGEETGRGRSRRGSVQARFTEESEGYESDATRIVDQICGPDSDQVGARVMAEQGSKAPSSYARTTEGAQRREGCDSTT